MQRPRLRRGLGTARGSSLQKGVAVGVKEAAAVGGQRQAVVADAAVHGAKGRQQAAPGVEAALQHLLA